MIIIGLVIDLSEYTHKILGVCFQAERMQSIRYCLNAKTTLLYYYYYGLV